MLMIFEPLVQIRYAEAGDFSMTQEGYLHCKTLPVYIFAQAYEGWYELEAGGEAVRCEEGGAFFTPPNLPLKIRHHVNRASGVMRVRYVHFLTENALGLDLFSGRKPLLALSAAECAEAAALLARILAGEVADEFRRTVQLLELFSLLRRFTTAAERGAIPEEIEVVCNWIRKNAGSAIRVEEVAKRAGMSRSKFFALFRAAVGMPPGDFILRERIHYAARQFLLNPSLSVKEVAALCNWPTPYHFSRCFRQVTGEPPGRYRTEARFQAGSGSHA